MVSSERGPFVAAGITGLLLHGVVPVIAADVHQATSLPSNAAAAFALAIWLFIDFGLAAITLLEGKVWTGLSACFCPSCWLSARFASVGRRHHARGA